MTDVPQSPNVLLRLAAEGVVPVLGGCAGALAGGSPEAGLAGVAVGHVVEKAVNLFGRGIVEQWVGWFAVRPPAEAVAAVSQLVTLTPADARDQARSILLDLAPNADVVDIDLAVEYLAAVPRAVDRAMVPEPHGTGRTVPPTVSLADPRALLQLLPEDVPPYPGGADLPHTPYRLVELVGSGGFGAVYRAFSPTLQHLPLAIKFCLDRSLLPALNQERSNLERLMRAGGLGANHVVRLYGYDLDHPTPFLVYEFVHGGDLTGHLAGRRAALGRPPSADEVLGWIVQIAEGLGFAHRAGVVHRDLKPANVLVDAHGLRLADFGIGGVVAVRSAARSRIGASTVDYLSLADQASLFRGAGTPLYMSPEQRRGADPDPRHDLYALGVVWFQLLVGDVSRELPHGWAKELTMRFGVPASHIALMERCVGWFDDRPGDANDLLPLLRDASGARASVESVAVDQSAPAYVPPAASTVPAASAVTPTIPARPSGPRHTLLEASVRQLDATYAKLDRLKSWNPWVTVFWGLVIAVPVGWLIGEGVHSIRHPQYEFPRIFRYGPNDWLANTIGIGAGLTVWVGYVFLIRAGMLAVSQDTRTRAARQIEELTADFPVEVDRWGGRAVLKSPVAVRQILDEVAPPPVPSLSPTSGFGADDILADPTRKAIMLARLRDVQSAREGMESGVVGLWVAHVFATILLVPGPVAGIITSADMIGEDAYFWLTVPVGILVGIGLVAGIYYGFYRGRESVRRKFRDAVDRFQRDYPKLVETWGGRDVLCGVHTVAVLLKQYDPESSRPGLIGRLFGG